MKIRIQFFSLLFSLITGCATSSQFAPAQLNDVFNVRTPSASIELYRSGEPTKKYIEIGAISACCTSNSENLIDSMKENASKNGGDALIKIEIDAEGAGSATVIRYQ